MIDDPILRAMEVASDKCCELKMGEAFCFITDGGWEQIIKAGIEAYEAAKWRPIEEAPRDGTEILIWHRSEAWIVFYDPPHWLIGSSEHSFRENELEGAMFRLIYPPQANASKSAS